jgi:hypothetical protein
VSDLTRQVGELLRRDGVWLAVAANALMTGRAVLWLSVKVDEYSEDELREAFGEHLTWADVDAFVVGNLAAVVVTTAAERR